MTNSDSCRVCGEKSEELLGEVYPVCDGCWPQTADAANRLMDRLTWERIKGEAKKENMEATGEAK
jgi:hypothetical protein